MLDTHKLMAWGSVVLGIVNIGFFIYGVDYLNNLPKDLDTECKYYMDYNIFTMFLFLVSVLVMMGYLCCGKIINIIFIIINGISLYVAGIHRFSTLNKLCNEDCRKKCDNLVTFEKKINYFYGTDMVLLLILFILCIINCIYNFIN